MTEDIKRLMREAQSTLRDWDKNGNEDAYAAELITKLLTQVHDLRRLYLWEAIQLGDAQLWASWFAAERDYISLCRMTDQEDHYQATQWAKWFAAERDHVDKIAWLENWDYRRHSND
jgi:hypothetical protein